MSSSRLAEPSGHTVERRTAELLRRWAGLALPPHRWPLLRTALEQLAPGGTVEEALARLESGDRVAKQALLAGITVPETYLFRHPAHFEVLAEHARTFATRQLDPYRVLSAGCATGEEAWSAAAVLDKVASETGLRWEVLGWDLDADRIRRARAGQYSAWSARNGLSSYDGAFEARGQSWEVHARLRGLVRFECVNLKLELPPDANSFDVVFLRNVAIYWAPECMTEMLTRIANLVRPGGLLLMGASEPETLDRCEWTVGWRGFVRVATRRLTKAPTDARPVPLRAMPTRAALDGGQRRSAASSRSRSAASPTPELKAGALKAGAQRATASLCPDPLDRVRDHADRGRYLAALSILDSLLPAPEAELYLWHGILCLNVSRPNDALSSMKKAVFLAPVDVGCRHWLAVALTACGQHEAAAREHRNLREISI